MNDNVRKRIAFALKCKPEEVPEKIDDLKVALDNRRAELKAAKGVKYGKPVHESL